MPKERSSPNPALLDKLRRLATESGLSDAQIARKMDFRHSSQFYRRLIGEIAISRTDIERFCNVLKLTDEECIELLKLAGYLDQRYTALKIDRQLRLEALLLDHTNFIRDRLASFVGRTQELAEIRRRIAEMLPSGGYITITGQAGQGKSSVIAKLVQESIEEQGSDKVAHHFIPFNPGPDHQVSLLRDLMVRLILKYGLSDIYVASESRPALRDYFQKVLMEMAAKGGQEVIFIDGLDQLQEDPNGERDLSFLPANPPGGVVFVLGTRPNDTLKPLQPLKLRHEYQLSGLSRTDFDLILEHRSVQIDAGLVDRFYTAMQANALYLDLAARVLAENREVPGEELVRRIAEDPDQIFSFLLGENGRPSRWKDWERVGLPILDFLLVARQPLSVAALQQLISVPLVTIKSGLQKLGDVVANDGAGHFSLFHLKLQEYLQQHIFAASELVRAQQQLANWCAQGGLAVIWKDAKDDVAEQERCPYARQHYVAHLYLADDWERLWAILDEGAYGQAKLHYDPSTRNYAQDLDLGRQAAAQDVWGIEGGRHCCRISGATASCAVVWQAGPTATPTKRSRRWSC